jgi:hypothetical protein
MTPEADAILWLIFHLKMIDATFRVRQVPGVTLSRSWQKAYAKSARTGGEQSGRPGNWRRRRDPALRQ